MRDILGFIASFSYLGVVFAGLHFLKCSDFQKRKILHFCMAQWWIIRTVLFEKVYLAVLGPIGFIAINFLLARRSERFRSDEYGMAYYAASLAVLTGISYLSERMYWIATVSLFVLGICDPCAAVLGRRFGKHKIPGTQKSYVGSAAFFLTALVVLAVIVRLMGLSVSFAVIVLIACVATVAELYSTRGMDNLFIPLAVFLPFLLIMK